MSRKIGSFFFICLLVLPLLGSYCWLQWRIKAVRKEVKHSIISGLDREELVLLRFHKEELNSRLRWEHSKEFEYDGEMYDVVHKEERDDSIFYHCWWDNEETQLSRQLAGLLSKTLGHDKQQKDSQVRLYKFLQSLYLCEGSEDLHVGQGFLLFHRKYVTELLPSYPPVIFQPPEQV